MLTVACVLWQGEFRGRRYGPDHVSRLRSQVEKNLPVPHRFVCLSNVDVQCEHIPLEMGKSGWWAKLDLFLPGQFGGRVMYLDLDITVVGPLGEAAQYPAPFAIIRDWNRPGFNSSVMSWDAGVADHLSKDVPDDLPGDQDWITQAMPNAATFPPGWFVSFKRQVQRFGVLPGDCKAVVYHGDPKPWDLPENHLESVPCAS